MTIILESNQSLSTVIVSFGFHLGNLGKTKRIATYIHK